MTKGLEAAPGLVGQVLSGRKHLDEVSEAEVVDAIAVLAFLFDIDPETVRKQMLKRSALAKLVVALCGAPAKPKGKRKRNYGRNLELINAVQQKQEEGHLSRKKAIAQVCAERPGLDPGTVEQIFTRFKNWNILG